jgi:RHS repeat-associated protein
MNEMDVPTEISTNGSNKPGFSVNSPQINLPKGGGVIRDIGEKFSANPVTGTGSMNFGIFTSPGRSGFAPQLSLSYNSGAGNGPFGLGWDLSLPAITRKTDKGVPKYRDGEESDVFILSGAEDLVPEAIQNSKGEWLIPPDATRTISGKTYFIRRYRPRVEGLFARLERWTRDQDPSDVFWRSISRNNITTWYGKSGESKIFDPEDPARIFSWLISQSYDDKGNAIVYAYEKEDSLRIFADSQSNSISLAHEANRTNNGRQANRYLKSIKYGNRTPNRDFKTSQAIDPTQLSDNDWMFEVVLDYDQRRYLEDPADGQQRIFATANINPPAATSWPVRQDPFSSYRAGFEIRTYRLCHRLLMFHHFPAELGGIQDYLVRSTELSYSESPIASFITSVMQSGYFLQPTATQPNRYLKKSLPPVNFEYSQAPDANELARQPVCDVHLPSLENLPYGLDGARYQWVDLDGEGASGILSEQGGAWFYKQNLSPNNGDGGSGQTAVRAKFSTEEIIQKQPAPITAEARQQLLDLAGDGHVDLVDFSGPAPGFYRRETNLGWKLFSTFHALPILNWNDQNVKFIDLTGDGHADILISEDHVFKWHASFGEEGFSREEFTFKAIGEEQGPTVLFSDGTESIFLADFSGDGLTDIVRIRNGEVCYWPNLGYGRFGAKVQMDNSPWFEAPDLFDGRRIRVADFDGSGVTDIIYLASDGAHIYFNQSGNSWSAGNTLNQFPRVDNLDSVMALDLLGNGTACLVWSSPLPGDARSPMRYIDLMGGQKPHLLVNTSNNLGAETVIRYAPSTKFYLKDKLEGKPWVTRLAFPVHCVERVETRDTISHNTFETRYAYHHGYFDGPEREFRGFGMVEQWDTQPAEDSDNADSGNATNLNSKSRVPPVHTKTWYHTGAFLAEGRLSRHLEHEYYQEWNSGGGSGNFSPADREAMLLPDTLWPSTILLRDGTTLSYQLTPEEAREVSRGLKGSVLRQEVYGLDHSEARSRPYSVSENNYTVELLQPLGRNRHAVVFTHSRETVDFHYERMLYPVGNYMLADPRVSHSMVLTVDAYGNVRQSVAIGYGRRRPSTSTQLTAADHYKQKRTHVTYVENSYTKLPIDSIDDFRAPVLCESTIYEILGLAPSGTSSVATNLFEFGKLNDGIVLTGQNSPVPYEEWDIDETTLAGPSRRLIERVRQLYYKNDLSGPASLGTIESLGLSFETYKLAFQGTMLDTIYKRGTENLLVDPVSVLRKEGGYALGDDLILNNWFPTSDKKGEWWLPSGQNMFSPFPETPPPAKPPNPLPGDAAFASAHFFLPMAARNPFGAITRIAYDHYDLLVESSKDALGNQMQAQNDYRTLQPFLVTDPNGNRSEVRFDAQGLVAGTAVMGNPGETFGDSFAAFAPDLTQRQILDFFADPHGQAAALLGSATTRVVYDVGAYFRWASQTPPPTGQAPPSFAATLAREMHGPSPSSKIQISFSYSDGFGREIQRKIPAEPDPLITDGPVARWVSSGWTIFNNKGGPVQQYEPFFSNTHNFEFAKQVGVSATLFYDPAQRLIGKLHPNHTWEKVSFDPWWQDSWDVNDTVVLDPKTDSVLGDYFSRLPDADYLPTWYSQRISGGMNSNEQEAAQKTEVHKATPTTAHLDTLGRAFLTVTHNRKTLGGTEEFLSTRVNLDIEGKQREIKDAHDDAASSLGRIVMQYDFDMLGSHVHQLSMEAGERWILNDATGKSIRGWDNPRAAGEPGRTFSTEYDDLRRPIRSFVMGFDRANPTRQILYLRTVYGETHPDSNSAAAGAWPTLKLRGKVFLVADTAGIVIDEAFDFKGNLKSMHRRFASNYKDALDWKAAEPQFSAGVLDLTALDTALAAIVETEKHATSTTYDALNRPTTIVTPDQSIMRPEYNGASLMERVSVNLRGAATATIFVSNIDYDSKGQRELIEYGNGTKTKYTYDTLTFQLESLKTARPTGANGVAQKLFSAADTIQDLNYTYDPSGNITQIEDDALQSVTYNGQTVDPARQYTYDAIYRLIKATGREHVTQSSFLDPSDGNYRDHPFVGFRDTTDLQALRNYTESYEYDKAGNFSSVTHSPQGGSKWIRKYFFNEGSPIEGGVKSNRLSSTTIGAAGPNQIVESYTHDDHGNTISMPHLSMMQWDFMGRLSAISRQVVSQTRPANKISEITYYVYDGGGQRVRKVNESQGGVRLSERTYLGAFEIYREYGNGEVQLERETLHVMDDKQRIALVETQSINNATTIDSPIPAQRYQLGNHLGSASLELDDNAGLITHEEYTPYGNPSLQAGSSAAEISLKRYRYTGKERDEETGFTYHGARYCAPWLGRWASCDPKGLTGELNLFTYVGNRPTIFLDQYGTDIYVHPLSKLTAKDIVDSVHSNQKIPGYLKNAISADTKKNTIKISIPTRVPEGESVPEWFESLQVASESGEWVLTTGVSSRIMQKAGDGGTIPTDVLRPDVQPDEHPGKRLFAEDSKLTPGGWAPLPLTAEDVSGVGLVGTTVPNRHWSLDNQEQDRFPNLSDLGAYKDKKTGKTELVADIAKLEKDEPKKKGWSVGLVVLAYDKLTDAAPDAGTSQIHQAASEPDAGTPAVDRKNLLVYAFLHEFAVHAGRFSGATPTELNEDPLLKRRSDQGQQNLKNGGDKLRQRGSDLADLANKNFDEQIRQLLFGQSL